MLRTVWSKTLRDYRIAILCWGIGLALVLITVLSAYGTQIQDPSASASLSQIAVSARFFADPVAINTPEGFTTWRVLSFAMPVLLGIWALLAGACMVRGEEERGSLDLLLATPRSRIRLLIEKIVALVIALVIIGLLIGLGGIAGEASIQSSAHVQVNVERALLAGLNVSLAAFFFASVALILSQVLASRGAAAGWTGGLIALSFLLDGTGRTVENAAWVQRLSPLYYYNLNKPLIPGYDLNPGAAALLLGLSLLFVLFSIPLFVQRDIGGIGLLTRKQNGVEARTGASAQELERARRDIFGHAVSLRALRAHMVPTFWWLVGLIAYAAWTTALTPSMMEPIHKILANSPVFAKLFSGQDIATNAGFLSLIVFLFVPVLTVTFALTQALKWSSDLDDGRMELILSTPNARTRILLERFIAVLIVALLAPLIIWGTVMLSAHDVNLSVDAGKVAAASFGILPLELIVIAFVFALAERVRSGLILGIVSFYLALAFLVELLRSVLNVPDWVLALSMFHSYGSPLIDGLQWVPVTTMLGIAVVLLLFGVVQFARADIDRGA